MTARAPNAQTHEQLCDRRPNKSNQTRILRMTRSGNNCTVTPTQKELFTRPNGNVSDVCKGRLLDGHRRKGAVKIQYPLEVFHAQVGVRDQFNKNRSKMISKVRRLEKK